MKKDIEWLRDEMLSEIECLEQSLVEGKETPKEYYFNNGKYIALVNVLKLINQLGEPGDEQKYYALIKGHELLADHDALSFTYWNFNMSNGYLLHGNKFSKQARFLTKMTKGDWNKLGITDLNADFVKVKEVE